MLSSRGLKHCPSGWVTGPWLGTKWRAAAKRAYRWIQAHSGSPRAHHELFSFFYGSEIRGKYCSSQNCRVVDYLNFSGPLRTALRGSQGSGATSNPGTPCSYSNLAFNPLVPLFVTRHSTVSLLQTTSPTSPRTGPKLQVAVGAARNDQRVIRADGDAVDPVLVPVERCVLRRLVHHVPHADTAATAACGDPWSGWQPRGCR